MTNSNGLSIVYIGAGSSNFGPAILLDLLENVLRDNDTLSLVDINERALQLMDGAAHKMASHLERSIEVRSDSKRLGLLKGADCVIITVEEDRMNRWKTDWRIPQELGIVHTLGENRGPGGLSHTLRTAPLVVEIAKDVEKAAPDATVIILTNPEDRLAYAVTKYTRLRAYGYCDGLWDFRDHLVGPLLGIPGERVHVHAGGINHAVWITDIRETGTRRDLYPEMVKRARETGWQPFGLHLYENYGLWPHENDEHYGEYFHYASEFVDCKGYDFDGHEQMDREWKAKIEKLVGGNYDVEKFVAETRTFNWNVFGDAPPSDVIRGVHRGESRFIPNANLPNNGKIPGLPGDMVVEVPGVASSSGIFGIGFPDLPEPILVFLHREGVIQKLSAEAAVEGSRHKALQSLLLDPQVRSAATAEKLLDAFLDAHADLIPPEQLRGLRAR